MAWTALLEGLLDALAPPRCAACDAILPPGEGGFCEPCESLLEPSPGERPRAAFLYGGPLADAVRRFKYGGRSELAATFAPPLIERAAELGGDVDAVVPVPLHPRRERARGYNQAALLARPVATALALPFLPTALRRLRDTAPQASLDTSRRRGNVRAAFAVDSEPPARVLLLDDVRTTGATLAECAATLRGAGATRVHSLVLARVES